MGKEDVISIAKEEIRKYILNLYDQDAQNLLYSSHKLAQRIDRDLPDLGLEVAEITSLADNIRQNILENMANADFEEICLSIPVSRRAGLLSGIRTLRNPKDYHHDFFRVLVTKFDSVFPEQCRSRISLDAKQRIEKWVYKLYQRSPKSCLLSMPQLSALIAPGIMSFYIPKVKLYPILDEVRGEVIMEMEDEPFREMFLLALGRERHVQKRKIEEMQKRAWKLRNQYFVQLNSKFNTVFPEGITNEDFEK